MTHRLRPVALLAACFCIAGAAFAQDARPAKTWIFFTDKLDAAGKTTTLEADYLSDRARHRRAQRASKSRPLQDAPISALYLDRLAEIGIEPVRTSRWLNAISARIPEDRIKTVRALPFVRRLKPVTRFTMPPVEDIDPVPSPRPDFDRRQSTMDLDFGASRDQLNLVNAIDAINRGIIGEGVVMGFLDTRFDIEDEQWFDHPVFDHLEEDQIEVKDYTTEMGDPQSNWHGLKTSSVAFGFKEGQLIGPAYGIEKIYGAVTEYAPSERNAEEDAFVEALEWMESEGVDVVNCSLGYRTFDEGEESYDQDDMDGDTAVTTIAADLAAEKGVVFVVSAGNNGESTDWSIIGSPADGDSVITVGGTDEDGTRVTWSATGPTADDRMKPDVLAQAVSVQTATPGDPPYSGTSGTSFSSPLVAGVAAQLLQAEPRLTPYLVRQLLRDTADRTDNPDNNNGWGLIDAGAAIEIAEACADPNGDCDYNVGTEDRSELPPGFRAEPPYPNPFGDKVSFDVHVPAAGEDVRISVYNLLGQRVGMAFDGPMPAGIHTVTLRTDALPAGLYLYVIDFGNIRTVGKAVLVR